MDPIQIALVFIVSVLGNSNAVFGSSLLNRPLVVSTLVGLALGDVTLGIQTGATLELVWLGAMAIGASNPPDMVSGTIMGTAYVITAGADVASAVALAVPVSMLMKLVGDFFMAVVIPLFGSKADAYAEACNRRGIDIMHWNAVLWQRIIPGAFITAGVVLGSAAVQMVVDAVPAFVITGLDWAMGLIPAIGFAMLARMIINKKTACFLFMGFLLVAYGSMNIVGVVAVACVIAAVLVLNVKTGSADAALEVVDDNEF